MVIYLSISGILCKLYLQIFFDISKQIQICIFSFKNIYTFYQQAYEKTLFESGAKYIVTTDKKYITGIELNVKLEDVLSKT